MSRARLAGPLAALIAAACLSTLASATTQRTFVASYGVDNPSCSLASPCRGFAAAIAATNGGGEVIVLDSAGYGPMTIAKSVSIIAPNGIYAGVTVLSGDGVTVMAGPSDKVVLRGLTINGQGGNNGIRVISGGETFIEECIAANLQIGIGIAGGAAVHIVRTVARGNAHNGVLVTPATATAVVATLADSLLTGNHDEAFLANTQVAGSTIDAALTRTTASGNGEGFVAGSANLGTINMAVADSAAVENGGFGVFVIGTNATATVSGSVSARNIGADFAQSSAAVFRTSGNNALTGRGAADIFGALTPNPLQ